MDELIGSRIDRGVPRGKRKTPVNSRVARGLTPKPRPEDLGTWVIPKDLDPDKVIEQYLSEASTSHIAASYGLSRRALVKWLRQVRPEAWREAQIIRAQAKLEHAEDAMGDEVLSPDALSLARMRETAKAMQFRLQALDKDYQPKQNIDVQLNHTVSIESSLSQSSLSLLAKLRGETLEVEGGIVPSLTSEPPPE